MNTQAAPQVTNVTSRQSADSTISRGEVRRRRWRKAGYTAGVIACLFVATIGSVFGYFYWGSKFFRDNGLRMAWDTIGGDPLRNWTPERQFPNRATMNVLVLGVDHDYDNKDQIVRNTWGRSDSILLARVDFLKGTVSALTIPRDSAVRLPGYKGIHKINAAHSYGGPQLTVDTIKSVFGVSADAVVSVNFEGFQQIVDAIGGVDVDVTKPLNYDDNWGNLHVHLKPGFQHLTGYQAMGFVRIRKLDSDEMRSKRQHEFLEALRSKVKTRETFMALPKIIDTLADNLTEHNITRDQMYTLINFARTLPKENIHVETLPSTEGRRFVTIDPAKSKDVIERIFFPNQVVALNIEAPKMDESERPVTRRHRRGHHAEPSRPTGGLSVEPTSPGSDGSAPQGDSSKKPAEDTTPAPRDDTSAKPADPAQTRATG